MPPTVHAPGPIRRRQAQAIPHKRRLLAHWITPQFHPVEMPVPKPTLSGQKRLGKLLTTRAKAGVQLFNARIMRAGHVTRQRGLFRDAHGLATLSLPLHTTDFNTWYQGRHSAEKREALDTKQRLRNEPHLAVRTKHKQYAQIDAQAHSDHAFNIGINSILEVGRGRDGQPTHILLLKRGPHVPEAPNHWDFPAGLIRAGQSPADVINHRVKTELGIEPHQIRRVGPGLQPTEQDAWLALHRIDKAHNYNAIVVQRADITVTAARRTVSANIKKAKKDRNPWAPTAFRLVPRTPDAIREFVRKNDATWMPEVLRLYARELYTAGKRTLNP